MFNSYGLEDEVSRRVIEGINEIQEYALANRWQGSLFYGYPIIDINKERETMKGVLIVCQGIFIIHEGLGELQSHKRKITQKAYESTLLYDKIDTEGCKIFFDINITDNIATIIGNLESMPKILNIDEMDEFASILQNVYELICKDNREIVKDNSLGSKIKERSKAVAKLDETQFNMLYSRNDVHTRIRGLAGSGKTILLVKKMAYLHFKDRDLEIAFVFFGKSLKQTIKQLFVDFYREFDKYQDPDFSRIKILHCWGGVNAEGFYSYLCKINKVATLSFATNRDFEDVCNSYLNEIGDNGEKSFDYVIVDEAQDFRINFFKLALSSLKPMGKLLYAYDELQTLNAVNTTMPSPNEIFGTSKCTDINLDKCYRSPKEILISAHALGLGIYHKDEFDKIEYINVIEDISIWEAIGYKKIEGEIKKGHSAVLGRDNIVHMEMNPGEYFYLKEAVVEEAHEWVVDTIIDLIKNEDVISSDIMIIDLDTINLNENFVKYRNVVLNKLNELKSDENDKRLFETNLVNKDQAFNFRVPNSIPYTTIFRAKGNESNIVFIINAHKMNLLSAYNRNRIFTAMTRSKFRVYLACAGETYQELSNEYQMIIENDFRLNVNFLTDAQLKKYKDKAYLENKEISSFKKVIEMSNDIKNTDPGKLIKLLIEQTGQQDVKGLLDFINNGTNKEE